MCAFTAGKWRVAQCYPIYLPRPKPVYRTWNQLGVLSHTPRQVGKLVNPRKLLMAWQRAQKELN